MAMTPMRTVKELEDASHLLANPYALRAQAKEDGLLFFRGLLAPEDLAELRRDVLGLCQAHAWLEEGTDLMEGMARPNLLVIEADARHKPFYAELIALRSLYALAMHPVLLGLFEKLFDEPVLAHSRNICRTIFPKSEKYTTPAHQDCLHIRGTPETWTTWIPLGDCPRALGGLAVARASHTQGFLPCKAAYGAGGAGVDTADDTEWFTTDYRAGDVITFHSYNVHQGQDNKTDRLRLSVDFRYQPASQAVHPTSLLPHNTGETSWDRIYSHWPNPDDPLKHYWKKQGVLLEA